MPISLYIIVYLKKNIVFLIAVYLEYCNSDLCAYDIQIASEQAAKEAEEAAEREKEAAKELEKQKAAAATKGKGKDKKGKKSRSPSPKKGKGKTPPPQPTPPPRKYASLCFFTIISSMVWTKCRIKWMYYSCRWHSLLGCSWTSQPPCE